MSQSLVNPQATPIPLKQQTAASLTSWEIGIMALLCSSFVLASYLSLWSISVTEAWGCVTGGICVWLVVREHMWNWPVGLANNIFFFFLFLQGRLFADMSLQVVYFGLGVYGWLNWKVGGANRSQLRVTRISQTEWIMLAVAVPIATIALQRILISINGAAPFWDSLTTTLSLAAQYLLCKKRLENWFFWIAADIIYVPLYLSRALPLTALLYAVFLIMCLAGVRQWNRRFKLASDPS